VAPSRGVSGEAFECARSGRTRAMLISAATGPATASRLVDTRWGVVRLVWLPPVSPGLIWAFERRPAKAAR
jgi:hypothetical protein